MLCKRKKVNWNSWKWKTLAPIEHTVKRIKVLATYRENIYKLRIWQRTCIYGEQPEPDHLVVPCHIGHIGEGPMTAEYQQNALWPSWNMTAWETWKVLLQDHFSLASLATKEAVWWGLRLSASSSLRHTCSYKTA